MEYCQHGKESEILGFPEKLRELMNERGETNYRLAKELSCSQSTIQNWLSGATKPTKVMVGVVASHYGVPPDELLAEGNNDDA